MTLTLPGIAELVITRAYLVRSSARDMFGEGHLCDQAGHPPVTHSVCAHLTSDFISIIYVYIFGGKR